jgi:hypothetical protein
MKKNKIKLRTWKHSEGYALTWHEGKVCYAHRLIYEQHFGPIPEGYEVHHKNKNRTDNRPENLVAIPRGEHQRLHALTKPRDDAGRFTLAA